MHVFERGFKMRLRKYALFLVILMMIFAGFSGCDKKPKKPGPGEFTVVSSYVQETGEHLNINAEYPMLKGFPGAAELNAEIKSKVDTAADEVRGAAKDLVGREGFSATLNSSYQYFFNEDLVSLWILWDNYTGGAHGLYWIDSYTFNTDTGQIYSFPELFQEGMGGVEYITAQILDEVKDNQNKYFDTAVKTIEDYKGDYQFLINGDELVVYFPLYDIAPYVAGIQHFDFSSEELEGMLRPEITLAMMGQESQEIPLLH